MKHVFLFLLVFCVSQSKAQRPIPINISLFNESSAIPFTRFFTTPIHPGIQLGSEFDYRVKGKGRLFQTVNLSYFYHNYLAQGVGIDTEIGYEYRLRQGFAFSALLGVGYLQTFATTEEYDFSNGEYVKKRDGGNPRFRPSFSVDVGYYLKKSSRYSPKLFVRYQSWIEYPYSPGFIPVLSHVNLHVGAQFFINSKASQK